VTIDTPVVVVADYPYHHPLTPFFHASTGWAVSQQLSLQ